MHTVAALTLQQWGNSLAVRIPSAIARSGHLVVGQPVQVALVGACVIVTPVGSPKLTLTQKLALFDPARHSGEVMVTEKLGHEAL